MSPEVLRMANWGKEKMVMNPATQEWRVVRKAPASPEIIRMWESAPKTLRQLGIVVKTWGKALWAFHFRFPSEQEILGMNEMEALSSSDRVDDKGFDPPCPIGKSYLPFQMAGIKYMHMKPGVILGDEMGLGKTVQIIGLINLLPEVKKVLIVCPAGLKANWLKEYREWTTRDLTVRVMPSSDKRLPNADVVIMNYDILWKMRFDIRKVNWDMVACDEAHYLKNQTSLRSRAMLGYTCDKTKEVIPPVQAKRRILATGSPMPNRTKELWPLLNYVDPDTWKSKEYYLFAHRYCGALVTSNGMVINDLGNKNSEELNRKMRRTCLVRREKVNVLKDLPAKTRQTIWIASDTAVDFWSEGEELNTKRMREVRANLERQCAMFEIAKAESFTSYMRVYNEMKQTSGTAYNLMAKMRKKISMAKIEPCLRILQETLKEGVKFIVFAHHIEAQQELHRRLEHSIAIPGGMDSTEKQKLVNRFQEDDSIRCAVLSLQGSSTGLTLTAASTVFMFEWDWVPGVNMQAEDRLHRIGQKDNVLCRYMVLEGSLDETMIGIILDKQNAIDRTVNLDGKAGTQLDYDLEKMFMAEHQRLIDDARKIPEGERYEIKKQIDAIRKRGPLKSGYDQVIADSLKQSLWKDAHYAVAKKFIRRHLASMG